MGEAEKAEKGCEGGGEEGEGWRLEQVAAAAKPFLSGALCLHCWWANFALLQMFHCPSKLSQSLRSPKVANKRNSSRDESSEHLLRDL